MELHCVRTPHESTIVCNGTKYIPEEEPLDWHDEWFWIYLGIYTGLVIFAGKAVGILLYFAKFRGGQGYIFFQKVLISSLPILPHC